MNMYLPYCATTNKENIDRLLSTITKQIDLEKSLNRSFPYKRWLFTDKADRLPHDVAQFFTGGIYESNPFIDTEFGRKFSISMLRNEAIRFGRTINTEWTMFCDSDTIIYPKFMPNPTSAFCVPKVYYQEKPDVSAFDSINYLASQEFPPYAQGNSWFIVHNQILNKFSYNEDFFGYGWEDNEFEFRISGAGHKLEVVDWTVVHNFHEHTERRIDDRIMSRNSALAHAVRWLIEQGSLDPNKNVPHMLVLDAVHPNWGSKIVICPSMEKLIRIEDRNFARYERTGNSFYVQWPFYPADRFRLVGTKLVYETMYDESEAYS